MIGGGSFFVVVQLVHERDDYWGGGIWGGVGENFDR